MPGNLEQCLFLSGDISAQAVKLHFSCWKKADIPLTQYSNETSQLFVWAPQNHLHNPLQDPQANPDRKSVV